MVPAHTPISNVVATQAFNNASTLPANDTQHHGDSHGHADSEVNTAAVSTARDQSTRTYFNPKISAGGKYHTYVCSGISLKGELVYYFSVDVIEDSHMTHAFSVETDITWADFVHKALEYFKIPREELLLGYRITGDSRKMMLLKSEHDWKTTMDRVIAKIEKARKHALVMEIRNMLVSDSVGAEKETHLRLTPGASKHTKGTQQQKGEGKRETQP